MRVAIQVRGAIYAAQAARRNRRARRRRRGAAACADSSPWASRAKRAAVAAVDAAVYLLLDSYPAVTTAQYNYPAAAHSTLAFALDNRHPYHGDAFFAAHLPGGVHRAFFFYRIMAG